MASFVTDLDVSLDVADEQQLMENGFSKVSINLNQGTEGNCIYLWYKKQSGGAAITRVQFSFNNSMADGLAKAGYTKVPKNLNTGAGGDVIYLWYFKGTTEYDTIIQDVAVTDNAEAGALKIKLDWERVACDLNRNAGGNWIHMWLKRQSQTYICDVTATASYGSDPDYFGAGYIRIDETTNRGTGGSVFVWYRQTTDPHRALTNVNISTNSQEYQQFQQGGFTPVNVILNEGSGGDQVYLWYKKDKSENPITALTLLRNMNAVKPYETAGVYVIEKNVNSGSCRWKAYLCVCY